MNEVELTTKGENWNGGVIEIWSILIGMVITQAYVFFKLTLNVRLSLLVSAV